MYCKDIRNEKGEWSTLEAYVMDETTTQFSDGICPVCAKKHFPNLKMGRGNAG